jgi:hypothetical protein
MIQIPNAVGITLCREVIVEEGTKNVTLVNIFMRLTAKSFPCTLRSAVAYAVLTDGLGKMRISFVIARPDTLQRIMTHPGDLTFTDPLVEQRIFARLRPVEFPVAGRYQVMLLANDELVTQCTLQIVEG